MGVPSYQNSSDCILKIGVFQHMYVIPQLEKFWKVNWKKYWTTLTSSVKSALKKIKINLGPIDTEDFVIKKKGERGSKDKPSFADRIFRPLLTAFHEFSHLIPTATHFLDIEDSFINKSSLTTPSKHLGYKFKHQDTFFSFSQFQTISGRCFS